MEVGGEGPRNARVMIVGEAPGADEERLGRPFVGMSGRELERMLGEAGIARSECFITNVCRVRPPNNDITKFFAASKKAVSPEHTQLRDRWVLPPLSAGYEQLWREIGEVQPSIIIALGNTALWALTGRWGITKWRGSMLCAEPPPGWPDSDPIQLIPTLHPAAVLREWKQRSVVVQDFKRAARYRSASFDPPQYDFLIRPTYDACLRHLDQLYVRAHHAEPLRLAFDLETRSGHIACAGLADSPTRAISIPFMAVDRPWGYWSADEECAIVHRLCRLLTHPNVEVVGQNLLYDAQYTWRWWHFVPRIVQDTMIAQHSCFSDMPKSLAFLASLYARFYVYWKDEGKTWREAQDEGQLWHYNCLDCCYTLEVSAALSGVVQRLGLSAVESAQQRLLWPVLSAMQRGVAVALDQRARLEAEIKDTIATREAFINYVLTHPLNPRSSKQMAALIYDDLRQPKQMTRASKDAPARVTLNDDALNTIAEREPLMRPLVNAIADIRTLNIYLTTFVRAPLDSDGRMRCSFNIGGSASGTSAPKTYRLSSSENAFGGGCNLQTIPSKSSKSANKQRNRARAAGVVDAQRLPNLRTMFVPDPGYTWLDGDLDRADLQVVVAEAGDAQLAAAMRMGVDMHLLNAFVLAERTPPPLEELVESHPAYASHRAPLAEAREFAKTFIHGTNYGGSARTMAINCKCTIRQAERAQALWWSAHPGIFDWQRRIEHQLHTKRVIENRFGYRWYVFDRTDALLPEALAWIPQSTVSIVINRIWQAIHDSLPEVEVLLQVHDSLCMQVPTALAPTLIPKILAASRIAIPYDPPLVIPFSLKQSTKSWGNCEALPRLDQCVS